MSKKDKTKETDKIKFFKIDTQGSIASAVPGKPEKDQENPHTNSNLLGPDAIESDGPLDPSIHPKEPAFVLEENEEPIGALENEHSWQEKQKELAIKIDALKGKVEDIAKTKNQGEIPLSNSQMETLKKYIALKEIEVTDLKDQQRQYQSFVKKVSSELEKFRSQAKELAQDLEGSRRREDTLKREVSQLKTKHEAEVSVLRNDYEEKLRQSGNYENELSELLKKKEEWKAKIKEDLKRIKLKERELENKYELLKRDTQALLDSKDRHLLELKKKTDAFEFEMESLEERLRQTNSILADVDGKKRRLVETLKLALSLLEGINGAANPEVEELKRKAG